MTLCRRRQNHTLITASEIADTMKDAALAEILATVRKELAQKTKPAGALDRIDDLVLQVARAQHSAQPQVMPEIGRASCRERVESKADETQAKKQEQERGPEEK